MILKICLYMSMLSIVTSNLNNCNNKRVTVIGIALDDKEGAFVLVDKKGMYFVDGLYEWDEKHAGKKVKVSGELILKYNESHSTDSMLVQESVGIDARLKKPKWSLFEDSSTSLIGNSFENKKITVIGTALNDKGSAIVKLGKRNYLVEGLDKWDATYYGKEIKVTGILMTEFEKKASVDSTKVQKQVVNKRILKKAKWLLVR
jgi:hypothetical protein